MNLNLNLNLIVVGMVSWVNNELPYVVRFFGGEMDEEMMPTLLACRLWVYTVNVLSLISSFTLTVFSGERALVMWMPLRMAPVFSSSKPRKIALSLVIIGALLLCSGHFHFVTRLEGGRCWTRHDIPRWQTNLGNAIFFVMPYAVPLVIISILNILILIGIKRNAMTNEKSTKSTTRAEKRCIINLLLVSFFFFVFNIPITVMANLLHYYQWTDYAGLSDEYLQYFSYLSSACQTMANFNACINPFIYTYSLDFYRKEMVTILCRKRQRAKPDNSKKDHITETAITDATDNNKAE